MDTDDSFTGALGDLLAHRTDIIANAYFIKDYGSSEVRFTSALYMDRLCIVVRAAELVWICIYHIYYEGDVCPYYPYMPYPYKPYMRMTVIMFLYASTFAIIS